VTFKKTSEKHERRLEIAKELEARDEEG